MFWSKKYKEEKKNFENSKLILENKIEEFDNKFCLLKSKIKQQEINLKQQEINLKQLFDKKIDLSNRERELKNIYDETFNSVDWLAGQYANFHFLTDISNTKYFKTGLKCSETAQKFAKQNRELREELINQKLVNNRLSLGYAEKYGNLETKQIEIEDKTIQLKKIYDETFNTVEWLSDKYSDFYFLIDQKQIEKFNPSLKSTKSLHIISKENRILRKINLELELKIKQFEILFPDFDEITTADIVDFENDLIKGDEDDINNKIDFLVPIIEQRELTKTEILQKALNQYINKKKSNYSIGKDYERYIGYIYEEKGYNVEYHGIKHGFDDLGIDIICTKGNETLLIQCKNWSKHKRIHENAINQLFGTSIKYYIDKFDTYQNSYRGSLFEETNIPFNQNFQPIFITTTNLSERAREFAEILKIKILVIPYEKNYPRIKCNIGKDLDNNDVKIFHLPFDQMYDKVQNIKNGGCNVFSIEDAEKLGYRKAFRWRGEK